MNIHYFEHPFFLSGIRTHCIHRIAAASFSKLLYESGGPVRVGWVKEELGWGGVIYFVGEAADY